MAIVAAYAVPHPPLIVPAVGRGEERAIQKTIDAYREVARRIAAHAPDTIVVISPHAPLFADCFHLSTGEAAHGDMGRFGAWGEAMNVPYDPPFTAAVAACARAHGVPICGSGMHDGELDHATYVPLYFVNREFAGYRLVRAGLSALPPEDHRVLGRCIAEAARDLGRRCVLVASGDLSHKLLESGPYGYAAEGPVFDLDVTRLLAAGDLEGLFDFDEAFCEAAAECGLRSFQIMAGALEGVAHTHELLSYEGPFGVGYAVAAFEVEAPDAIPADAADEASPDAFSAGAAGETTPDVIPSEGGEAAAVEGSRAAPADAAPDPFVALARASVEAFVRTGRPLAHPGDLPPELEGARAGVFVSLHEDGELRGCIGTIEPVTGSIADEIIRNGVAAASEEPRFPPVRADELDALSYSVDVLFPPEPIGSPDELDPARFGVIVEKGWRRGLLLPNLDGVDTVEQQVAIARRKAGIGPDEGGVSLARFEVVRRDRGGEARRG